MFAGALGRFRAPLERISQQRFQPFPHAGLRSLAAGAAGLARLGRDQARLVSPGAVTLPDRALGFGRAVLMRDPDGHALELVAS